MGSKCGDCGKQVSKKDAGLQCDICDGWFHAKCQKVNEGAYEFLAETSGAHWFCMQCDTNAVKTLKSLSFIQERQDKIEGRQDEIDQKFELLKNSLDQIKLDIELKVKDCENRVISCLNSKCELVEKEVDGIKKSSEDIETKLEVLIESKLVEEVEKKVVAVNDRVRDITEDVKEKIEIESKRFNLIIHGLDEGDNDELVIESIMRVLKLDPSRHIQESERFGSFVRNKNRPVRLVTKTLDGRREILSRGKCLKDTEDYKNVFITPDLTRKQQKVDRDLRQKVKQFREEDDGSDPGKIIIQKGKVVKNLFGDQDQTRTIILYDPMNQK